MRQDESEIEIDNSNESEFEQADGQSSSDEHEDTHLAAKYHLVPIKAYIKSANVAKSKTANAARQARYAEKKKAEGLTKVLIPIEAAKSIKDNGFSAWLAAQVKEVTIYKDRVVEKEVPVYKDRDVVKTVYVDRVSPDALTEGELYLITLGKKVEKVDGWKRFLVNKIIGD